MQGTCSVCSEARGAGPGRGTESVAARAAPIVPEERANAVEELRPWLGPEMTRSISPG